MFLKAFFGHVLVKCPLMIKPVLFDGNKREFLLANKKTSSPFCVLLCLKTSSNNRFAEYCVGHRCTTDLLRLK